MMGWGFREVMVGPGVASPEAPGWEHSRTS